MTAHIDPRVNKKFDSISLARFGLQRPGDSGVAARDRHGSDDREVLEQVRAGIGVVGVIERDAVLQQVDADAGVVENGVAQDGVVQPRRR